MFEKSALDQHNAGKCMYRFRIYCIGRQFMTEDRAVMISFSNVWNLLTSGDWCPDVLDFKAELCQTHATTITANNETHRKHFKDDENYEKFYDMLCDILRITCEAAGYYFAELARAMAARQR